MKIYRITFIGHRKILGQYCLEDKIKEIIKEKILSNEYVELYVGRNGDFDIFVASAAKKAQKALGDSNSRLILVQPYPMKNDQFYEKFYDEILYPNENGTHPKAAITKRNRWMIDNADLLVAYAEPDREGGTAAMFKYAANKGIETVNLATQDN